MIGEDDRSVALGDASHGHVENAMGGLDVMLLQAQDHNRKSQKISRATSQSHCRVKVLSCPGRHRTEEATASSAPHPKGFFTSLLVRHVEAKSNAPRRDFQELLLIQRSSADQRFI